MRGLSIWFTTGATHLPSEAIRRVASRKRTRLAFTTNYQVDTDTLTLGKCAEITFPLAFGLIESYA
jgi:hypothetical protein